MKVLLTTVEDKKPIKTNLVDLDSEDDTKRVTFWQILEDVLDDYPDRDKAEDELATEVYNAIHNLKAHIEKRVNG